MSSLADRFEEILHWDWQEFLDLEKDPNISTNDDIVCQLIRVCADTDEINAAKLAFDRADGLLETPIKINVPKVYVRYLNATDVEPSEKAIEAPEEAKEEESTYDIASAKLRDTLQEMRRHPKQVVNVTLLYKKRVEQGKEVEHIPKVKSVIVANLLKNSRNGNYRAIELLFDQIDGKLTRTITLLGGEDIYVDDYMLSTAPAGAIKDKNGHYVAENKEMSSLWLRGFAQSQKGLEMLAEGLEE